jgi:hypothetical protein
VTFVLFSHLHQLHEEEDEEDEEFLTPASSPELRPEPVFSPLPARAATISATERKVSRLESVPEAAKLELCESLLYKKMYDKFSIQFNNMQIIVAKVSWFVDFYTKFR